MNWVLESKRKGSSSTVFRAHFDNKCRCIYDKLKPKMATKSVPVAADVPDEGVDAHVFTDVAGESGVVADETPAGGVGNAADIAAPDYFVCIVGASPSHR